MCLLHKLVAPRTFEENLHNLPFHTTRALKFAKLKKNSLHHNSLR